MTPDEARLELDACTLRPQDASPEACAHAAADAQLAAWVDQRARHDRSVAEVFESLPCCMPADFREKLLASENQVTRKRHRGWITAALASAAACVVMGWQIMTPEFPAMQGWQAEAMPIVAKLETGLTMLDKHAPDLESMRGYLAASNHPCPNCMPESLAKMRTFGCKRIRVAGRPAVIICFDLGNGKEAHLVVRDQADEGAPSTPQITQDSGWSTATWSDGRQTFLLATKADVSALKQLLGLS